MSMPFVCPACSAPSLEITRSIDLGSTPIWDELALQVVGCNRCGFRGVAVYEESRRGALDQDIRHHTGYWLDPDRVEAVEAMIASCPNPDDHRCACLAHRRLITLDARTGSWVGIAGLGWVDDFPMERAQSNP